jgi:hypothetical protein
MMYGANPVQLAQLMSTVDRTIGSTTWQGPARQCFEQEWNGSLKQTLHHLDEAFGSAGRDCIARSDRTAQSHGRLTQIFSTSATPVHSARGTH